MTQRRNTVSTCAAQWKMWLFKVFGVLYITAVCASQEETDATTYHFESVTAPTTAPTYVPPVPDLQLTSTWSEVFPSEKVELRCSVTNSSELTLTWKKDGSPLSSGPNLSWSADQSVLTITATGQTDSGSYSCVVQHRTKHSETKNSKEISVKVHENKPKPTLNRNSNFDNMFPGESITFTCGVNVLSGWAYLWYHNEQEIKSSNNETYKITQINHQNSGHYKCKAKRGQFVTEASETTTLQVSDPPTPVLKLLTPWPDVFENEAVEFACEVPGAGWTFTWYRNQQQLPSDQVTGDGPFKITSASQTHKGPYTCKAHLTSRGVNSGFSNTFNVDVYESLPKPNLSRDPGFNPMYAGETVTFTCKVAVSSGWKYHWYKGGREVSPTIEGVAITLNVSVGGEYHCKATRNQATTTQDSEKISLTVLEIKPKTLMTQQPDAEKLYAGDPVSFECKVEISSGWSYHWYKDDASILTDNSILEINNLTSVNNAYTCRAKRDKTNFNTEFSDQQTLHISEIPVPTLKQVTKWLNVFPTESAKLSCGMEQDSSDWTYTWYKDEAEVQADDVVSFDMNTATLSISSASAKHTGQYKCSGRLQNRPVSSIHSSKVRLTVYDNKPTLTLKQDPEYNVMFHGESLTFSCNISTPSEWEYLWYKDGRPLSKSSNKYLVNISGAMHGGSYTCKAKRGENPGFTTDSSQAILLEVKESKPKPLMTQQPDAEKLYAGESVSFVCKVEISSGWSYHWYKDGASILTDNSNLTINNLTSVNNGAYKCSAKRDKTNFNTEFSDQQTLHISEIPVPTLKQVTKWLDVFPTESAKLSCGMEQDSSDWTYTWHKDGKVVQAYNTEQDTVLSIRSASVSDRGSYSCSGKLKSRDVHSSSSSELKLDVYDTKPTVRVIQNPEHNLMHSEDSVSFSCHINVSSGWEYLWYKDGSHLTSSGSDHNISSVMTTDSGSYTCKVKRGTDLVFRLEENNAVVLKVEERPKASIELLTGWSEVFSTDSLVLQCKVEEVEGRKTWNYTWFREKEKIDASYSEKHTVTPNNDKDQSVYTCRGIHNERPLYSKLSDPLKTKNLLLKRRVLLSISGCIFFGIIAVLIGCIVLRVFRKPADGDDKLEDINLFPTMAQLKITDTSCPLVEYITDASLNAPAKEGEENGTVCSETTPLPITKQEDQAATTDGQDTAENNGGLVSFQH